MGQWRLGVPQSNGGAPYAVAEGKASIGPYEVSTERPSPPSVAPDSGGGKVGSNVPLAVMY